MIDVDRSERDRLEQTDAFKELVQMNQKQSVNRPQQVTTCVHALVYVEAARALFGMGMDLTICSTPACIAACPLE